MRIFSLLSGQSSATRRLRLFCGLLGLALLSSCSAMRQETVLVSEPLEEPVLADPKPMSPGTLWNGDEGNLLADVKARRVGDIVTVIIREEARATRAASTATERESGISAGIASFFGLEQDTGKINPASMINANTSNEFSGSGTTSRSENLAATLTTQVVEVYANGNMKIRGGKSVVVNNENQVIYLTGIVRPYDVGTDNTVDSGNILNAQITYTGKGIISDKQKPGWMARIFDHIWPF